MLTFPQLMPMIFAFVETEIFVVCDPRFALGANPVVVTRVYPDKPGEYFSTYTETEPAVEMLDCIQPVIVKLFNVFAVGATYT